MAVNFSKNEEILAVKNYYGNSLLKNKFFEFVVIHKKKLIVKLSNLKNRVNKFFIKEKKNLLKDFQINTFDTKNLSKRMNEDGYIFIKNFLSNPSFNNLKLNWPKQAFFYAPDSAIKNYSFGFRYFDTSLFPNEFDGNENKFINFYDFKKNETIFDFYKYLCSEEFEIMFNKIIGKKNYKVFSIVSSIANENSYLIPHQDTVIGDSTTNNIVNVILFIEGSENPEYSGGTGIYSDNEFKLPIFIPDTLKNSALIYNSKQNFFHGFKKMKKNNYRWAISFQLMKFI